MIFCTWRSGFSVASFQKQFVERFQLPLTLAFLLLYKRAFNLGEEGDKKWITELFH